MTKKEALDVLNYLTNCKDINTHHKEAMEIAIEALEQQNCDDAVNRQTMINMIKDIHALIEKYLDLLS